LIAEYTFVTGTNTLRSLNVWGQGLLWTDRQGTKRYYHFDGEGSTRALTDSSQNVTATYEFTSFGELIAATGAAINPFRWKGLTGAYDDLARGCLFPLTLMQAAHWNAETATWLNAQRRDLPLRYQECTEPLTRRGRLVTAVASPRPHVAPRALSGDVPSVTERSFCVRDYECPVKIPKGIKQWIKYHKQLYCRVCEVNCVDSCLASVPWESPEFDKIVELCHKRYLLCMLRAKWAF
jgi:hypothetical protein